MTDKMRVSAIITAYNSEMFVAEAIASVLEQTCPVDDIVVVDDGSTDRTRDIVSAYAQGGVRYLYQENQGPGAARNYGLRETSGELVTFLDADDIWLKDKNKVQLELLSENPDVALVSGFAWWWNVRKDLRAMAGQVPQSMTSLRRDMMVDNKIGNPSRVMVRRSVLEAVRGFDPTIRWGQDWDLWIRIIEHYRVVILPTPVMVYRWHEDNLSHTRRWERSYSYWKVSRQAISAYQPAWQRPLLMLRSWSLFTLRRASSLLEQKGLRWRAIAYATAAFLAYPLEMGRGKFKTLLRAVVGDRIYEQGKRLMRPRSKAQGEV
jgi:glycosyltransferase involved in cell wall biosynthesis